MKRTDKKEPLYRKVNTKARRVLHHIGGDFKHVRHKRQETLEQIKGTMFGKKERGLDYTPLYRFLLSKAGSDWDEVFSEAKARLDKTEPIFLMVALHPNDKKDYVRLGDSTYFSGMYVDESGILQLSNPRLEVSDLGYHCNCCTHTFNGKVY